MMRLQLVEAAGFHPDPPPPTPETRVKKPAFDDHGWVHPELIVTR